MGSTGKAAPALPDDVDVGIGAPIFAIECHRGDNGEAATFVTARSFHTEVVIDMLEDETDRSTRSELENLTPSGDLLDLARAMRDMGVESLLICRPGGQIEQVVTDREIARLAASAPPAPGATHAEQHLHRRAGRTVDTPVHRESAIPRQAAPLGADQHARLPVPLTRT